MNPTDRHYMLNASAVACTQRGVFTNHTSHKMAASGMAGEGKGPFTWCARSVRGHLETGLSLYEIYFSGHSQIQNSPDTRQPPP